MNIGRDQSSKARVVERAKLDKVANEKIVLFCIETVISLMTMAAYASGNRLIWLVVGGVFGFLAVLTAAKMFDALLLLEKMDTRKSVAPVKAENLEKEDFN